VTTLTFVSVAINLSMLYVYVRDLGKHIS